MEGQDRKLNNRWICIQRGTREHYLVPRALQELKQEVELITEFWIKPNSLLYHLYAKSRSRYDEKLKDIKVSHFNRQFLTARFTKPSDDLDVLFDTLAEKRLGEIFDGSQGHVFTNSYTSLKTLKLAKSLGLKKIYQQINGGPAEAEIVKEAYEQEFGKKHKPFVPTEEYWQRWYEEITYPDSIIVNSEWTKKLLIQARADENKIHVIPFSYKTDKKRIETKEFPLTFSRQRPLRILYLGSLSIRKGFHLLRKAMEKLINAPVTLNVVGRLESPDEVLYRLPVNITYHNQVSSFQTEDFYKEADVFILPTLSDGFALTQLEAFFYRLPVITTPFCGKVVTHLENGYIMNEVTVEEIQNSIQFFLDNPDKLSSLSENTFLSSADPLREYGSAVIKSTL